jgi:hypothetical protein
LSHVVSRAKTCAKVTYIRVWSVLWFCASRSSDRTRWHVRSRSIGRVQSLWELTRLQPDAGTVAFGQFCSAFGHYFVGALLRLDQRVRSVTGPARPVELHASGQFLLRVRSSFVAGSGELVVRSYCGSLAEHQIPTLVDCSCQNFSPYGRFLWRPLRGSVCDTD